MSRIIRRLFAPFRARAAAARHPWTAAGLKTRLLVEGMENRVVPSAPAAPPGFLSNLTTVANTTPVTISTSGTPTVTSTINVTGANAFLHDVDVITNITHTWTNDLRVTLTSPAGTVVTIFAGETASGSGIADVFNGTRFDDDADPGNALPFAANTFAASNLATDTTYTSGTIKPTLVSREPLAAFRGENPNGTWTLTVQDAFGGDGGAVTWAMDLTTLDFASPLAAPATFTNNTAVTVPATVGVVTSTITVSGQPTYLGQLTLQTFLAHTASADLDVTLTSPMGTVVTIVSDTNSVNASAGTTGANFFNGTLWTDYADPGNPAPFAGTAITFAASNVVTQAVYTSGTVKTTLTPEEAFGAFIGEDPNGVWTLTISDDTAVNGGTLTSWALNLRAPSPIGIPSANASAPNITAIGATTQTVTVVYADASGSTPGIDASTIDVGDLVITGPGGPLSASLVSVSPAGNGTPRTATYTFNAPGGTWDQAENGTYTVTLLGSQVADVSGNFVPGAPLTTFSVTVPLVVTVTTDADSGTGSLRDALAVTNANPGADFISFDPTFFATPRTIALVGGLLVSDSVTITGPGASLLTVSGGGLDTVFAVISTAVIDVAISNLTVSDGYYAGGGGGFYTTDENLSLDRVVISGNSGGGDAGGGIYVRTAGTVRLTNSTISGNTAGTFGGGIYFFSGGSFLIQNSTISGNTASGTGAGGGGIYFFGTAKTTGLPAGFTSGTLVLQNSTVANNTSAGNGGAVTLPTFTGTLLVQNSTITGNTAAGSGGGIHRAGGTITVQNSVVSGNNNATAPDIFSAGTVNVNFSAVGSNTGFTLTGANNVPFGTNLLLGTLGNNGGPTQTILPQTGSPLLNAGSNALVPAALTTDQRGPGALRVFGAAVDIGAIEVQPLRPLVTVGGGGVTYVENATPLTLDATLGVTNLATPSLSSATVQITAGLDPALTDVLTFIPAGAISGSFDASTGTLTLSGIDTLANYQTVLRSVAFSSTSDNPTTAPRTVTYIVTDTAANVSNPVTKTVNVTAVNDAAAVGAVNPAVQTVLDSATIAPFATVTITDPDSASVTVTVTYTGADGPLTNLGGFTGSAGSYTFTGDPAAAQTALRGLLFDPNEAAIFIGSPVTTVFTIAAGDGVAPPASNNQTTVQAVNLNDAPTFMAASDPSADEDAGPQELIGFATVLSYGPANESGQAVLAYEIRNVSNPALFTTAPAVGTSGRLTFTPAPNANGSSTFEVRVRDDGGTAGGGVDASAWQLVTLTVNPVNDAPTFTASSPAAVDEDAGPQSVPFATVSSFGAANESGQAVLAYEIRNVSNPGLFSAGPAVSTAGVLTYTPLANANGSSTFEVRVRDDAGGTDASAWQQYTIVVNPVNDAPTFTATPPALADEDDGTVTVPGFVTNFTAGPANESAQGVLAYEIRNVSNAGLFTTAPAVSTAGELTYTLAPDANGSSTFEVRVRDDAGGTDASAWQQYTITVNPVNDAPLLPATITTLAVSAGTTTPIIGLAVTEPADLVPPTTAGYSATVSVPAGEGAFTPGSTTGTGTTSSTGPENVTFTGTLEYVNSGLASLSFAPTANGGSVIITLAATDGGNTGGGVLGATEDYSVTIKAKPVITLTAGDTVFTENGPAVVVDSGLTITDSDSTVLTRAVVTLVGFIPGEDTLTYTGALPANVTADTSVPGQITFATAVGFTTPIADYEALLRTVTYSNGSLFPTTPDNPADRTVRFTVTDEAATSLTSSPADKPIDINDLNDTPVVTTAVPPTSVFEEGTVAVTGVSVTDVDAGTAPFRVTLSTTAGTLAAAAAGVTVTANPQLPDGPFLLILEGPIAAINTALAGLTFTGGTDFVGSALVGVTADDLGNTGAPGPQSATGSFSVTVNAVNDAPSFTPGADVRVNEDTGTTSVLPWATNILRGPADEAGQTVSFQVSNSLPGAFTAAPAIDANGNLTFTVRPNAVGVATVTVRLTDNGGTANGGDNASGDVQFTITIDGINDTPAFTAGGDVSVTEDSGPRSLAGWARGISAGPVDESGQTLQFVVTASNVSSSDGPLFAVLPAVDANGTLTFTPAANANGTSTVTVQIRDSGGTANGGSDLSAAQTFTITVVSLNDPPQFLLTQSALAAGPGNAPVTIDHFVTSMFAGAPDEVSQTFVFEVTNNGEVLFSQQPTITAVFNTSGPFAGTYTGRLSFAPAGDRSGVATVTVRLRDSGGDTFGVDVTPPVQSFTITVTGSNTAPSFTAGPNQSAAEDAGPQTVAGWATNLSPGLPAESGQALTFLVSTPQSALFAVQPAVSANGTLTYTPAADAVGTATMTVQLMDDGGTAFGGSDTSPAQTFTIQLTPVNDAPRFTIPGGPVASDPANGPRTVPNFATGIAAGPADENGQTLTFLVTVTSGGGLFTAAPAINPVTGALTFTPAAAANGTATVTVQLQDNGSPVGTSAAQTFTIVVAPGAQNSPPTAGPDAVTVAANSGATAVPVLANDSFTPDTGETLSVTAVGSAANGTVTLTGGQVFYAPASGFSGTDTFTYTLSDGNGGTATGTVTVTVTPPVVVDPPPTTPAAVVKDLVAVGDTTGSRVRVVNAATGQVTADFLAFPGFEGGVNATVADVTGDGVADVIVGAGPGGGPVVKVFDGRTFAEIASFHAFLPSLRGGVHVSAGDVNGDGRADIVLGAGPGGGPHVKVVDGTRLGERDRSDLPTALLGSFFAYAADFLGGVSVAAGDVDGDGKADVITGAGPGGSPHVKVYDGATMREVLSVIPYNPDFRGGVNVGAGDLDGDGRAEIITGAGVGGSPHVGIYDGRTAASKAQFFAFPESDTKGVTVAVRPLSAGGATLATASASGALRTYTAGVVDDLLDGTILGGIAVG